MSKDLNKGKIDFDKWVVKATLDVLTSKAARQDGYWIQIPDLDQYTDADWDVLIQDILRLLARWDGKPV
ncbi:MAG: hypothetical protein C4294_17380 [Nitrospiraceae bacterium]